MSSFVTNTSRGTKLKEFYEKKIIKIKKKFINLILMIFAVTILLHCNGKNLKSQINEIFLDQTDFCHQTD